MLAQSTSEPGETRGPSRPGSRRRSTGRLLGSTPTTSQVPSTFASSISLAVMSRPPTKLMRWRAEQVLGEQQLARRGARSGAGRPARRRSGPRPSLESGDLVGWGRTGRVPRCARPPRRSAGGDRSPTRTIRSCTRPIRSPVAVDERALDDPGQVKDRLEHRSVRPARRRWPAPEASPRSQSRRPVTCPPQPPPVGGADARCHACPVMAGFSWSETAGATHGQAMRAITVKCVQRHLLDPHAPLSAI